MDEKLSWIDDLQAELQSNVSKASRNSHTTITQTGLCTILLEL